MSKLNLLVLKKGLTTTSDCEKVEYQIKELFRLSNDVMFDKSFHLDNGINTLYSVCFLNEEVFVTEKNLKKNSYIKHFRSNQEIFIKDGVNFLGIINLDLYVKENVHISVIYNEKEEIMVLDFFDKITKVKEQCIVLNSFFSITRYQFCYKQDNFYFMRDRGDDGGWFKAENQLFRTKDFHIKDLLAVELLVNSTPVSIFKRAAVGTLIFGGIGTLTGVISGLKSKKNVKLSVALQLDDIQIPSLIIKCGLEAAFKLIHTLAKIEKDYYDKNPSQLKLIEEKPEVDNNSTNNNFLSEEIMKLKKMLDDGVIDEEEFKAFKRKLLNDQKAS